MAQLTRRPGAGDLLPHAARPGRRRLGHASPARPGCSTRSCRRSSTARGSSCYAKPDFYLKRGTLSPGRQSRSGRSASVQLLARLEQLRALLAAEGLVRRRPQAAAAVPAARGRRSSAAAGRPPSATSSSNARRRWPGVEVRVENVAVQGAYAVPEVIDALRRLDRDPEVDVIVVTRGGGSRRGPAAVLRGEPGPRGRRPAVTPVVSAIGHEQDTPLLDLVADVRASTPTDAARLRRARRTRGAGRPARPAATRARRGGRGLPPARAARPRHLRAPTRARRPHAALDARATVEVRDSVERARRAMTNRLDRAADELGHTALARPRTLPRGHPHRGYAVVQRPTGAVVRDPDEVPAGELLRAHVAAGEFDVRRDA